MNRLTQIIDGGYCVGCGGCASDGTIPVSMNKYGMYQADASVAESLSQEALVNVLKICPFSDDGPNEDVIGEKLFGRDCQHDPKIGFYRDLYIGHVAENDFREKGTSGGVITWILTELLKTGKIDAVVHVKRVENPSDGILFRYGMSRSVEEIMAGAKSRYYPIEMSGVLRQIKETPGRYAVVGLPCFIKAVRRMAEIDSIIQERVVFCIGLVCGHLKSKAFADCFGWQTGIPPGELEEIDFRVKLPGRTAGNYGVYLRGAGKEVTKPTREFLGSNWGHNFFRYPACDFCDDIFAETADMAIGDAWLPEYENDPKGNSIIVVRNNELETWIGNACTEKRLAFTKAVAENIAASQSGGLRDRREGLAYRLYLKQKRQEWAPQKRVKPDSKNLKRQRARIYRARSEAGAASHRCWKEAVEQKEFCVFRAGIQPYVKRIQRLYRSFFKRVLDKLKTFYARAFSGNKH
jgi:coenzyme F420 hydrogenase subunit beta